MRPARLLLPLLLLAAAPARDPLDPERARLAAAKAEAAQAAGRAAALDRAAAAARDAAAAAAAREAAVAARIDRARADLRAAHARVAIAHARLEAQRAALARRQAPAGRLIAALLSLARRPAIATVAQPGSVEDMVHVRAALGTVLPAVRARSADLRRALARTRALAGEAALAARGLEEGRTALVRERGALAALRAAHAGRATALTRDALVQSDRAIAMGEAARDIMDQMAGAGERREIAAALARLPDPPAPDPAPPLARAYRLPVAGRLVTGLGELSAEGVRARGLTFAVASGATVVAPAAGRIVFARPFRRYGVTVIVDHGRGWASVVTGLATARAARGAHVAAGDPIGRAPTGDAPRVTVELYRRNRPVDIAALIG